MASLLFLTACGGGEESRAGSERESLAATPASEVAEDLGRETSQNVNLKKPGPNELAVAVGESLFKDENLSASKKMSCATCHAENAGHADKPGVRLPLGGPNLDVSGMRSSPTARYLNENKPFAIDKHGVASGGFTWDGRADSRKEQARAPFFEQAEMALPGSPDDPRVLTALVRASGYFADLQTLYKPSDIDTDAKLFDKITELIDIYQRDDEDYNLFDSRYDQFLARKAALTPVELRGLAIFNDANKGNCASCHSASGRKPLFTDFGYAALAAPRNHAGPKNVDPDYFDLGLCMRERARDSHKKRMVQDARYCGMFKTPTLRNVDRTAPYFHNGSVETLEAAVRFHFERDTQPAKWYLRADGTADRPYNDLPQQFQPNIARGKPFNGSYSPTDGEIADLLAFLRTLNDADQVDEPIAAR